MSRALFPPNEVDLGRLGPCPPCTICGGETEWNEVVVGAFEPHCTEDTRHDIQMADLRRKQSVRVVIKTSDPRESDTREKKRRER